MYRLGFDRRRFLLGRGTCERLETNTGITTGPVGIDVVLIINTKGESVLSETVYWFWISEKKGVRDRRWGI